MTTTAQTGARGERAVAEWLRGLGYELCDMNWRQGRYELDIVALRGDTLHLVEVKTRRAGGLTTPEEAITPQKMRALHRAAQCYLADGRWAGYEIQFDLAAVECHTDGRLEIRYIERAIEWGW